MRISTVQPHYAQPLRSLAEREDSVAAVPASAEPGSLQIGGHSFRLLTGLPEAVEARSPGSPPTPLAQTNLQFQQLKAVTGDFALPSIKVCFPGTSEVVTGVQVIWASNEFWDLVSDPGKDGTQRLIGGVKLMSAVVGLGLSVAQVSPIAQNLNTVMGFLVSTADKCYALQLESDEQAELHTQKGSAAPT